MEEWRDIRGFEGFYQLSNENRVKSVKRVIIRSNGRPQTIKEKILKPQILNDYLIVHLRKGKINCSKYIHILMAETFIPNPENKPEVDHKEPVSNGGTNKLSNLRWVTHQENMNNPQTIANFKSKIVSEQTKNKLSILAKQRKKDKNPNYKGGIDQIDAKTGEIIKTWNCAAEASENGFNKSCISECINNKRKEHKGFIWKRHL